MWQILQSASTGKDPETKEKIRQLYSGVAETYHQFRPKYPDSLIDEAIDKSKLLRLNKEARILEIGCGPGTLTLPLAKRGYRLLAIDPGAGMIAKARQVCQNYPNVEFRQESFKDFVTSADDEPFDAIVAASSLHWALAEDDQAGVIEKMNDFLKDRGTLILFWNYPPEPNMVVLDEIADATGLSKPFYFGNGSPDVHWRRMQERVLSPVESSPCFTAFETQSVPIKENIPIESYISLLRTLSNYITMEDLEREAFFQKVREIFQKKCGSTVPMSRESILNVSVKSTQEQGQH